MKKVHSINGETGLTHCGRDPEAVMVSNGQDKVTCKTCLRVVGNAVNKAEFVENTVALTGGYLQHRLPGLYTEVKFQGLADHHMDAINHFAGIHSALGILPKTTEDIDTLDAVQMIGVRDRLANIKQGELQAAWGIVRTVRSKGCPKDMLKFRDWSDEEIAGFALWRSMQRGLITVEDLSWALHVSLKFGEPTSSLDEDNMKMWEENKKRDRQMKSNDIEYQDPSINVDIDDPIDRPCPIGNEATFTTEGDFGQVQIIAPNDLKSEDGLYFDLWAEERTNSYDGSIYLDPQARTRSAILSAVRELLHHRAFKVRGDKLVWKLNGFHGQLTAAATRGGDKDSSPWKVALPLEMVYRHLGYKDDAFGELLDIVKNVQVGRTKIEGRINWKSRQRMVRMWHMLREDHNKKLESWLRMPRHLVIKIWVHKDEDWRVALGLPPVSAAERKPTKVRKQTCFPPKPAKIRTCRDCGTRIIGNAHPGQFIIGREEHDGLCIHCLHKVAPITMDPVTCPDCGKENTYGVTCWCSSPINGSTDGQLPVAAG